MNSLNIAEPQLLLCLNSMVPTHPLSLRELCHPFREMEPSSPGVFLKPGTRARVRARLSQLLTRTQTQPFLQATILYVGIQARKIIVGGTHYRKVKLNSNSFPVPKTCYTLGSGLSKVQGALSSSSPFLSQVFVPIQRADKANVPSVGLCLAASFLFQLCRNF